MYNIITIRGYEGTSSYVELDRENDICWKPFMGSICEDHSGAMAQKFLVSVIVNLRKRTKVKIQGGTVHIHAPLSEICSRTLA